MPHSEPLEEIEYIDEERLVVEEIAPEEFQRLVEYRCQKKVSK